MKKIIFIIIIISIITSNCETTNHSSKGRRYKTRSKTYRSYYRGKRGGCYYLNSKRRKVYVSRSKCR